MIHHGDRIPFCFGVNGIGLPSEVEAAEVASILVGS